MKGGQPATGKDTQMHTGPIPEKPIIDNLLRAYRVPLDKGTPPPDFAVLLQKLREKYDAQARDDAKPERDS